jgi:hypothetical protein
MAKEYQPKWLDRLALLPVELGNTLLETCRAIEERADNEFKDDTETRKWVSTYIGRVVGSIFDWWDQDNPNLRKLPLSAQPYTLPAWRFVVESLVDGQGIPINENDSEKIGGLLDSISYVPTVLSSDIFIRKAHFQKADQGSYYMALVHREYILANASSACISNLPQIEQ